MIWSSTSTLRRRLAAWRERAAPLPVPADWFTEAELAGYDATLPADDPDRIDDATWRDLDVKSLLRRIAGDASIYARQDLFRRLRRGADVEYGRKPDWLVDDDEDAPGLLADTARARLALRSQDMEVTGLLFRDERVALPRRLALVRWAKLLWLVAPLLALAGSGVLAALSGVAYLMVWGSVEIRFHARLQAWKRQRRAVLAMLEAVVDLGAVGRSRPHPALADVVAVATSAQRLRALLDLDAMERQAVASDYLNLLTLHEYAVAPDRMARFDAQLDALRPIYAALAECDGRLCLMGYLQRQGEICWARLSKSGDVRLVDLRNPLLDDAQPLSLEVRGEGVFLTGENGVGKSTFLRAIGLNLLTARAFGYCLASEAAVPLLPVWSSMVHEESIEIGDSLYMAEMRRAQDLLRVAERPGVAVFLVDEVFRGTNHVDSVAASAAVLHRLAAGGTVIVSSHHTVLAPLLRARLAPRRIVRGDAGRLVVEPGVLLEPNGIAMMQRYGIADDVRAQAMRVHAWFATHVATPASFPALD